MVMVVLMLLLSMNHICFMISSDIHRLHLDMDMEFDLTIHSIDVNICDGIQIPCNRSMIADTEFLPVVIVLKYYQ